MRLRPQLIASVVAAGVAGAAVAVAVAVTSAGAVTPPATVTLGSTSGTPSTNLCALSINCTYVPFSGVANPELQVPADGTVTSFSINSNSAGAVVELRVLAPATGGAFTGAGTSPAETLTAGVNTFTVSLPVQAGDVLALDNNSSALLFASVGSPSITAFYEPSLADGATGAPNEDQTGDQLLLSATVALAPATSTTVTTPTVTTTTTETTTVQERIVAPNIARFSQSHRTWREGSKLAVASRTPKPPVGTVFSYSLDQSATAKLTFVQKLSGRVVHGKCKSYSKQDKNDRHCTLSETRGTQTANGKDGRNQLPFQGALTRSKRLPVGSYTVALQARNTAGLPSTTHSLSFTIAR
jgi:hypothetical protein